MSEHQAWLETIYSTQAEDEKCKVVDQKIDTIYDYVLELAEKDVGYNLIGSIFHDAAQMGGAHPASKIFENRHNSRIEKLLLEMNHDKMSLQNLCAFATITFSMRKTIPRYNDFVELAMKSCRRRGQTEEKVRSVFSGFTRE